MYTIYTRIIYKGVHCAKIDWVWNKSWNILIKLGIENPNQKKKKEARIYVMMKNLIMSTNLIINDLWDETSNTFSPLWSSMYCYMDGCHHLKAIILSLQCYILWLWIIKGSTIVLLYIHVCYCLSRQEEWGINLSSNSAKKVFLLHKLYFFRLLIKWVRSKCHNP